MKDAEKKVTEVNTDELISKIKESLLEDFKKEAKEKEAKEKDAKAILEKAELENELAKKQEEIDKMSIKITGSGSEKLLEEIVKRLENQDKSYAETLAGLQADIKEKAAEIEAIKNSKMNFNDKKGATASNVDIDTAVLAAKIMGKSIDELIFGKNLITKSNTEHWNAPTGDWESAFVSRIEDELRLKLKLEPLFTKRINMVTPTMYIPTNPEAGTAEWVKLSALTPGFAPGSPDHQLSSGNEVVHQLGDVTLIAQKLATKEYIGFEEEEDVIIPIIPIIRDSIVRRMARATDIALLRGTGVTGSAQGSGYDPIKGIAQLAVDASDQDNTSVTITGGEKVTMDILASMRRGLGNYGLNPDDIVFVVSKEAYFDLIDDPDFRTVDMVGAKATILTGQVGQAGGSAVVVSGEFETKASGKHLAVVVYTGNFIFGPYKGVTVERDRQIVQQQNVIVSTRRFGFIPITASAGTYVLTYGA